MSRLVICEDDPLISEFLVMDVESMGYEVIGKFENGQELLDHIPELSPDVILMDVNMPKMDGISAAKRLRLTSDIPIVFVSGSYNRSAEALSLEATSFVPKPWDRVDLELALRRGVALHSLRSKYEGLRACKNEIADLRQEESRLMTAIDLSREGIHDSQPK
jgi:YesN/AraC family two-component response regulator